MSLYNHVKDHSQERVLNALRRLVQTPHRQVVQDPVSSASATWRANQRGGTAGGLGNFSLLRPGRSPRSLGYL